MKKALIVLVFLLSATSAFAVSESLVIADGASVTASVFLDIYGLTGISTPAMTASTAYLEIEVSDDPMSTSDANATWLKVYDVDGSPLRIPVSTSAAQRHQLEPGIHHHLGRLRFRAITSTGSSQNQTGEKTLVIRYRRY